MLNVNYSLLGIYNIISLFQSIFSCSFIKLDTSLIKFNNSYIYNLYFCSNNDIFLIPGKCFKKCS